jgi:hypothetical protein
MKAHDDDASDRRLAARPTLLRKKDCVRSMPHGRLGGIARFGFRPLVSVAGPAIVIGLLASVLTAPVVQSRADVRGRSVAGASSNGGRIASFDLLSRELSRRQAQGADDALLLGVSDVPGFSVGARGPAVARKAVGGKLPPALTRATAQGVAFHVASKDAHSASSRALTVGVFVFPTSKTAAAALHGLASGRKPTKVGAGGLMRNTSTKKVTDVAIVFRVGAALGAVRYQAATHVTKAPAVAVAYAKSLASRLDRVLTLTAFQRTLDGIHADGSITPALALQAFTIAYGPLPGVGRPSGSGGAPSSATVAMQMVARVWSRLNGKQQAAIDQYLGARHDGKSPRAARAAAQVLTPSAHYTALANKYNAIYHARLPGTPSVTIKAFTASEDITTDKGVKAAADSQPVNKNGEWGVGKPEYCRVRVTPAGQAQGAEKQELDMAHEAFHCIEFVLMADWRDRSDWLIEGLAEWASVTVDPVSVDVGGNSYKTYLMTPTIPLFARAYSASGFWGHADEVGGRGSLWGKIPAIMAAPDDPTSFALAGGTQSAFVDTWASAAWRYTYRGAAWNQSDPFPLPNTAFLGFLPSAVQGRATVVAAPYTLKESVVFGDPDNPLVYVQRGMGSLRAGETKQDLGPVDVSEWFCLAATCKCPPGETSSIPSHRTVGSGQLDLALTGGNYTGTALIVYHSLDEFCDAKTTGGGIMVFQHSVNGGSTVVANFVSASCRRVTKSKSPAQFTATSTSGAYKLRVGIRGFDGFHEYALDYQSSNPSFVVDGPGGSFSNLYWPGGTPPNHGGYITFSKTGAIMGLGFIDAWNKDFSDDIVIAGTAKCKYSK